LTEKDASPAPQPTALPTAAPPTPATSGPSPATPASGPRPAPVTVPSPVWPAVGSGLPIPGAPIRASPSLAVQPPPPLPPPAPFPPATSPRFVAPLVPTTFPPFWPAPHNSPSPAAGISAGTVGAASPAPPIRQAAPPWPTADGCSPSVLRLPGTAAVGPHGAGGIPGAPGCAATSSTSAAVAVSGSSTLHSACEDCL
jgi:hypothetical protein